MVPIASYYLGASPSTPMSAQPFARPQSMSQASLPRSPISANSLSRKGTGNRASMPAPSRTNTQSPQSSLPPSSPESRARTSRFEATMEEDGETEGGISEHDAEHKRNSRGEMNREFRFPVTRTSEPVAQAQGGRKPAPRELDSTQLAQPASAKAVVTPSSIEVPPPPPVEKERSQSSVEDGEDDVGDTVDIPL